MDKGNFNGNRLKKARVCNGISLTELARQTGLSKQSVSLYENGKNIPDIEKVWSFSRVLNFPVEYFFQVDRINTRTETTYFRSQATTNKKDRVAQSMKLEFVAQMYEVLWEYVDFPPYNDPKLDFSGYDNPMDCATPLAVNEMENMTQKVRNAWDIPDGPIDNLQYLLEKNGILVTGFSTDEKKIDAFSQRTLVDGADVFLIAIALGKNVSKCRIQFDMAHELGHIVLHPWSEDIDVLSKDEFKARERQANMFAGSFLLPKHYFLKDVLQYPTDLRYYQYLKKKWNVSIQAMIFRARQLNAITANQYQYLMRQVSKNGWRLQEPDDAQGVLAENIFQGAVDLLFANNVFSPKTLLAEFRMRGVSLYSSMIEELLHLKKGCLDVEDKVVPILRIK